MKEEKMDYISVRDASIKFGLSERRIQKLCEDNRINGCIMVSGVWLIPSSAKKPADERISDIPKKPTNLTLKQFCDYLSISEATGRNWIRLNKIKPNLTATGTPYFDKQYAKTIKREIKTGENSALKSRRNKKYISGNSLYNSYVSSDNKNLSKVQKLLSISQEYKIKFNSNNIGYLIADYALHLFASKNKQEYNNDSNLLAKYLNKDIQLNSYKELVEDLIDNNKSAIQFCKEYPLLFKNNYSYEPKEDILGLIYISFKNLDKRKATGVYYTPTTIVKKLISQLNVKKKDTILDPCCGTGNFLLQLPNDIPLKNVYGGDTDSLSVKIARVNMALRFKNADPNTIKEHISEKNYLLNKLDMSFDYIIGNPPWGYDFSKEDNKILREMYRSTTRKKIESYDVFVEKALSDLSSNGQLSFVLPEAILNVKAHEDIRKIIMDGHSIKYLEYLGNAFDGVQCPSVILQLVHTGKPFSSIGTTVNKSGVTITIETERDSTSERFSFLSTDSEYKLLKKIRNQKKVVHLADNADFALGIVTGNNKKYIRNTKTKNNEMVLKGSDIRKFHFNSSDNYIVFEPDKFQQVAPTELYRAPEKLLYKFISSQLVFAYDNKQTLSLNSCNVLIPKIKELDIKYVLAVLNSSVAQFIFKKEFNSFKVLRSHIESIPIPLISKSKQKEIIMLVNPLIKGLDEEEAIDTYKKLDQKIYELFNINKNQQDIIYKALENEKNNII